MGRQMGPHGFGSQNQKGPQDPRLRRQDCILIFEYLIHSALPYSRGSFSSLWDHDHETFHSVHTFSLFPPALSVF
jgi:hypothetical protein